MSVVQLRPKVEKYPIIEETKRPFRIWDAEEKRYMAHRCFSDQRRALDRSLLLVRWGKVGCSLEVLDVRTARWLGAYTRKATSIIFHKG